MSANDDAEAASARGTALSNDLARALRDQLEPGESVADLVADPERMALLPEVPSVELPDWCTS